tara:strand:+ start:218 stop:706 length:489 start_codon:yes stop_codon:yes gene_type:complete
VVKLKASCLQDTHDIASRIAHIVSAGDLLLLVGDLGAGKTAFAQGFGKAIGIKEPITSPTFTLAREYKGKMQLHHLDVYRLEQIEEVRDLALPELFEGNSVTLIEWGNQIISALPKDHLEVFIEHCDHDDERMITLIPSGEVWNDRMVNLQHSLTDWTFQEC